MNNELYFADTFKQERALLAELVADPASIQDAMRIVSPEMFNDIHARKLYTKLVNRFAAGESDMITMPIIYGELTDDREKEWYRDVVITLNTSGSIIQIETYAKQIRNAFECRRLFELSEQLRASAIAGTDIPEALEQIRSYQEEAINTAGGSRAKSVSEAFNGLCNDLQDRRGHIPTGFPSLDRATYGGFAEGNLIIVAARPSVGKTSVALDIARSMSYNGAKVAFFSLEMTSAELAQKLLLGTDRLTGQDFRGRAEDLAWDRIEAAGNEIGGIDMVIDDNSYTLNEICAQIVMLHAQGKCSAAFVDYLGLIEVNNDPRTPLAIKIATATRRLKILAKKLQIPIVVLCQLNRESSKEHRSPELFDLRDSGAIEQDANVVLMLERAASGFEQAGGALDSHVVYMWVRKNRSGEAGNFRIDLEANKTFSRFHEIYDAPAAPAPAAPAPVREYNPDEYHEPKGSDMSSVKTEFEDIEESVF